MYQRKASIRPAGGRAARRRRPPGLGLGRVRGQVLLQRVGHGDHVVVEEVQDLAPGPRRRRGCAPRPGRPAPSRSARRRTSRAGSAPAARLGFTVRAVVHDEDLELDRTDERLPAERGQRVAQRPGRLCVGMTTLSFMRAPNRISKCRVRAGTAPDASADRPEVRAARTSVASTGPPPGRRAEPFDGCANRRPSRVTRSWKASSPGWLYSGEKAR